MGAHVEIYIDLVGGQRGECFDGGVRLGRLERLGTLVDTLEGAGDVFGRRNDERQPHSQGAVQLVRVDGVRRVGDRNVERAVVVLCDRNSRIFGCELLRKKATDDRIDFQIVKLYELELVLLGDEPGDDGGGHDATIDQDLTEPL